MSEWEKSKLLSTKLEALTPKKRMVFAVDTASRALPQYETWAKGEGKNWGQPERLKSTVRLLWRAIESGQIAGLELEKEYEAIYALVPDTEEFRDASGIGALDAGIAVVAAIKCVMRGGDTESAVLAGESGLISANVTLGQGEKFRHMSPAEIAIETQQSEALLEEEWIRQLIVLDKLSTLREEEITREKFTDLSQ